MTAMNSQEALARAAVCLTRADDVMGGHVPSETTLRRAELNIQLAHAYLRYVEISKEKA